jgi:transglutaminase-like putative cysteine protease
MKLTITHTLTLALPSPSRAVQHVLLSAQATPQQRVEHWSIDMPGLNEGATFRDGFGNKAHLVTQTKPGESLAATVSGVVETTDKAGVLGRLSYDPPPAMFLRPTALTKADDDLIADVPQSGGRIAVMHELMGRVFERTGASQSQSDGAQSQTTGEHHPVALAHAFIAAARALDIPARFVTGYLFDEGTAALHAWAEAWDDGLGWIGFDPLLNMCPTDTHVRLACGLDAMSTIPIRCVPAPSDETVHEVTISAE